MVPERYESTYGQPLDIDVCHACNSFWFDGKEGILLGPAATLALFKSMSQRRHQAQQPHVEAPKCPRCAVGLERKFGMMGVTRYHYEACPTCEGRFMTFFQFLKEKRLVRQATPKELNELKSRLQEVACSNCGATIVLRQGTVCGHCESPVSILSPESVKQLAQKLKEKAERRVPDPAALGMQLALIKQQADKEDRVNQYRGRTGSVAGDLVLGGMRIFLGF